MVSYILDQIEVWLWATARYETARKFTAWLDRREAPAPSTTNGLDRLA